MGNVRQFHSENDPLLLPDNACLWRYVPLKTLFFYLSGNIEDASWENNDDGIPKALKKI